MNVASLWLDNQIPLGVYMRVLEPHHTAAVTLVFVNRHTAFCSWRAVLYLVSILTNSVYNGLFSVDPHPDVLKITWICCLVDLEARSLKWAPLS